MNPREEGFLLLTGFLGDPERKPLTVARFRELAKKAQLMEKPAVQRDLTAEDLQAIGCNSQEAEHILLLLSQKSLLKQYLHQGREQGCEPITRVSPRYPLRLRKALGLEAPGAVWVKGDLCILEKPAIALVGSRDLHSENRSFAREVGVQAAQQGYVLISGDARGADKEAQQACLEMGGQVIAVVSNRLADCVQQENILYLSRDGYDLPFTPYRALLRNPIIHILAEKTFIAQCTNGKGGTWDGTVQNLRHNWSSVFCFQDNSPAAQELENRGAILIPKSSLQDIGSLSGNQATFFSQW